MMMKKSIASILEHESQMALGNLVPKNWILRSKYPDSGIDIEIEIVEGERITNKVIWCQIKAIERVEHSHGAVHYSIDTKYLKYYEGCHLPVVILLWVKQESGFYYLFAQKFIQEELSVKDPNWRNRTTKTIEFSEDSKLKNANALNSIARDGFFYIVQQRLSRGALGDYWLDGIPSSADEELEKRTLKALSYMRKEEYCAAIAEFERILRICTVFPFERMAILLNLGNAYYSSGQNSKALENYSAVLELAERVTRKDALEGKASALGSIGLIYSDKGDLDNALKYHQEALKIHREIGYRRGEASDLGNIGVIYRNRGDLDNALKHYLEALKIDREIGYRQGEASDLGNIGVIYRNRGDLDNALKHYLEALKIDREIGYRQGEANHLGNIGLIYKDRGDLDNALKHHQEALKIHREVGYRQGEANQLGNIGLVYSDRGDLDNALKHFTEALKIDQEIGYRQGEANQLGNIGLVYSDKGDLDNALKHHQEALKIHREVGYRQGEANSLGNIGIVYRAKGDLDNALKHHQEALKIHREVGYRQGEASDLGNIGIVYRAKGDLDNALKHLTEALKILDRYKLALGRDTIQKAIESITQKPRC